MKNFMAIEISDLSFKIVYYKQKKEPLKQISILNYDSSISKKTFLNDLQAFIENNSITTKNIALIIKEHDSIKRFINVPNIRESLLETMIHNNLTDFFPISTDDHLVDYKILSKHKDDMDIMLIAIKKSIIDYYLNIFESLNLNCFCIDTFYNSISDYFCNYKEQILICYMSGNKYFIIHMEDSIIKNIREFDFLDETNIFQQVNRSFGFYSLELAQAKKVFLLDDCSILYDMFNKYNMNIYTKQNFIGDNIELLAILGLINRFGS